MISLDSQTLYEFSHVTHLSLKESGLSILTALALQVTLNKEFHIKI